MADNTAPESTLSRYMASSFAPPKQDSSKPKPPRRHLSESLLAGEYKRGGKVKRTGLAKVHKGERVLTAKQSRKYRKGKKR